ncbi:MAG TPA: response regulator [Candidatus Omnitrophota bacterium]|nr:response regulator [Candidatus Omnitrophota bacterium]HPD84741.1 response regulator [Candidatus Omnitrophota bacterium]HRZ03599.1 response regulator [Candidatus Omnitrophota bacterium]
MGRKKILVVEDENDLRQLIAEKLEAAGYDVYTVADGEQGLTFAREIKPDCILSDVVMPRMDGNKMIKALRESDFGRHIPVIVLTARTKMRDYFEMVEVAGFIDKPFKTEELVAKIEQVLAGKKSPDAKPEEKPSPDAKPKEKPPVRPRAQGDVVISAEVGSIVNTRMMEGLSLERNPPKEPSGRQPDKRTIGKPAKINKVLIVDETVIGRALEKYLAQQNCIIKVVSTPSRCLTELSQFLPDIILSKFILAEMNADAMAGVIKQMPLFEKVPIVIYGNIGRPKEDSNAEEGSEKEFVFNAEGYEVLRRVSELLEKLKTNSRNR